MSKQYYVGDVWEIDCEIEATRTSAAVDPSGLTIEVKRPDKTTTTVTPTKTAVGKDYAAIPLTQPGTWQAVWKAPSGEYQGVEEISVSVKRAPEV